MEKQARLILTTSYHEIFGVLTRTLENKTEGLSERNIVFCEEKVSLMAERRICDAFGGTFNTDVYSFGNYLAKKRREGKTLSKEGSAMAVKRILSKMRLQCFNYSKTNLAPSLFELITQLKSAGITPCDVYRAAESMTGVLKNKLADIAAVFQKYQEFLNDSGYDDQSSLLSYLPDIIEKDPEINKADVFIAGYTAWTRQARNAVSALLRRAKSVTAILTGGKNDFLYVNETAAAFKELCEKQGIRCITETLADGGPAEAALIRQALFDPASFGLKKTETDKILFRRAKTVRDETEIIAKTIKSAVMGGMRYRDMAVALPDLSEYGEEIKRVFGLLKIPFFLDEKKKPLNHPLIRLIAAYIDVFRSGKDRNALSAFFKNPIYCNDKDLTDRFENYLVKYNINYGRINSEFTLSDGENLEELNAFRRDLCETVSCFDIHALLQRTDAENKLKALSEKLKENGFYDEAAVCSQIYSAVCDILSQLETLLGDDISLSELKTVFLSGVSALELSIIPQYEDAVFIGGYRETGLARTKYLFAAGLKDSVPAVKDDVALLSDGDINRLYEIKIMVEPKINLVNRRTRENTGLGLSAFGSKLFLSYPVNDNGKKNSPSEIILYLSNLFSVKPYDSAADYLTAEQGLLSFAKACGEYADGVNDDFSDASAFYYSCLHDKAVSIAEYANKEIKMRLDCAERAVISPVTSPTAIEDFYVCPFRAFASHVLRLKDREEGNVSALSVGNLMHEIFNAYVARMGAVTDRVSSDALFANIAEEILSRPEYARYSEQGDTSSQIQRVLKEARDYCHKIYLQFKKSLFKPVEFEKKFETELIKDKVTLVGKIDRIDAFDGYYRIVDYKTGKVDGSDKSLFAGLKLQLYLYASSLKGRLAGVMYLPVSEEYTAPENKNKPDAVGKFLDDERILYAQDSDLAESGGSVFLPVTKGKSGFKKATSEKALSSYVGYAEKVSRKAADYMLGGVIAPSPYKGSCEHCPFKGLCGGGSEREVGGVDEETIIKAAEEGE